MPTTRALLFGAAWALPVLCDPLFSVTISVDQTDAQLTVFEDQHPRDAALQFAQRHGLDTSVVESLSERVQNQLDDHYNAKGPAFTVEIAVDDKPVNLYHFDGQDPVAEARSFCVTYKFDQGCTQELTAILRQKMDASTANTPEFSVPVTINGNEIMMKYFTGQTADDAAWAFCVENGLTEDPSRDEYIKALGGVIRQKLEESATEAQSAQQPQPEFSVPVQINGNEIMMKYFTGQTADDAAWAFCVENGLTEDPSRDEYIKVLGDVIRQRLEESAAQAQPAQSDQQLEFSVPININEKEIMMKYFTGQTAEDAAWAFCVENGLTEDPSRDEYMKVLSSAIRQKLSEQSSEGDFQTDAPSPDRQQLETDGVSPLFTLPVEVNDTFHDLVFYQGEQPSSVARDFCTDTWVNVQAHLESTEVELEVSECTSFLEDTITSIRNRLLGSQA
jgi:preprotein translocase subunit Sss1